MLRQARYLIRKLSDRIRGIPGRSANPYATHLPVLVGLGRLKTVSRVLEFGCGKFSTLTFLDRRLFPKVSHVQSFENDLEWCQLIRDRCQSETRLQLGLVPGRIADVIRDVNLEDYDLILIDDSTTLAERVRTIEHVTAASPKRPIVVIHDFELDNYRQAAVGFSNSFRFTALNPNTGIVCNSSKFHSQPLRRLNRVIRLRRHSIEADDSQGWLNAIMKELPDINLDSLGV